MQARQLHYFQITNLHKNLRFLLQLNKNKTTHVFVIKRSRLLTLGARS